MEQLLAFVDWERLHNPHPDGKPHVAEWAAAEIERLHVENERLRGVVGSANSRCDHLGMRLGEVIRERDALRTELGELDALRDRMASLLSRTAVALRGPEPPLTRWSWHDLPERAAAAVAAIDLMQRTAIAAAANSTATRTWSEAEAVAAAHAAGFAGTYWTMGPEELVHLLNMVRAQPPGQP